MRDQISMLFLRLTDLRFDDFAVRREGLAEGVVVGGPGEAADEATVLNVCGSHGWNREKEEGDRGKMVNEEVVKISGG